MDNLVLIIGIPVIIGFLIYFSFMIGGAIIWSNSDEKEISFSVFNVVKSIILGFLILFLAGTVVNQLGCGGDDSYEYTTPLRGKEGKRCETLMITNKICLYEIFLT